MYPDVYLQASRARLYQGVQFQSVLIEDAQAGFGYYIYRPL